LTTYQDTNVGTTHQSRNPSYQAKDLRKISLPSPSPVYIFTITITYKNTIIRQYGLSPRKPRHQRNKRRLEFDHRTISISFSNYASPNPSFSKTPARVTTPAPAPPSAPIVLNPTPTRSQSDENSLSTKPNGSLGKKARRRQEALERAAIAACSWKEVLIKSLKGTGPAEAAGETQNKSPAPPPNASQPEADKRPPSPTKQDPPKHALGRKSKRRYEQLDLNDEAAAVANRDNFLKTTSQDDKVSVTASDTQEPTIDSPQSPGYTADQHLGSTTTSHRADKQTSKRSKRH